MELALDRDTKIRPVNTSQLRSQRKQVVGVLKHLVKEMNQQGCSCNLPTQWMLQSLVYNCLNEQWHDTDWHHLLQRLATRWASGELNQENQPLQPDGITPLYPNDELWDDIDVERFGQALHDHLGTFH